MHGAQSGKDSPHLVELYTSDGMQLVSAGREVDVVARPETRVRRPWSFMSIIGIRPAWHDPYDSKAYAQRQEMLVEACERRSAIYTPQIWLDGGLWHNWPKGAPPTPYSGTQPNVQVDAERYGDSVKARVTTDMDLGKQRVFVALTENGLGTAIRGGENKGKTLANDQVVRSFAGPFDQAHIGRGFEDCRKKSDISEVEHRRFCRRDEKRRRR